MGCRNGQKKAETATLKKCRDRSFTWGAETGKMAFCIFLCRNGVIPIYADQWPTLISKNHKASTHENSEQRITSSTKHVTFFYGGLHTVLY